MKMNLKDTAKELGVTEYFLRQEAKAGRIPAYKPGNKYIFDVELVEKFLNDKFMANVKTEEKCCSCQPGKLRKVKA